MIFIRFCPKCKAEAIEQMLVGKSRYEHAWYQPFQCGSQQSLEGPPDFKQSQKCQLAEMTYLIKRNYPDWPEKSSGMCSHHQGVGPVWCSVCWPSYNELVTEHVKVYERLYRRILKLAGVPFMGGDPLPYVDMDDAEIGLPAYLEQGAG